MSDRPRAFDLFLLAPLGLAVVAYQLAEPGEVIPPIALIVCVVARAVQDATGWVLGKTMTAVAVAAAILYVLSDVYRNQFQVTLFADFMMILAALKAMERRTPRDDGQLLVVSIFVALSAAVSSNRMGTGVLLVLYLFSLMFAVMRMQIDAAMWPARPARRGRLWPLLCVCIAGSTTVAVIAFALLPRSSARWSPTQFSPLTQRVSGFRESVELGTGGLISQDPSEVMRVSPVDRNGDPGEPFAIGTPLYLRGAVLTEYQSGSGGGRWKRAESERANAVNDFAILPGASVSISGTERPATIRVVQHAGATNAGTVFTMWRPIFINFDQAEGSLTQNRSDFTLKFNRSASESIQYRVTYGPDTPVQPGQRRGTVPIPSGSEILRTTARQYLVQAGIEPDPARRPVSRDSAAIQAIADALRASKGYTLDVQRAEPGRDPTEWFIEEADAGHCEYFASALALLSREVGINSRVATGYLAVVENDTSEFTRVRRSDAHAWVEAEIAPGAWAVFDATPAAQGGDFGPSIGPIARWLSSIESVWLSSFISYDSRSQSSLSRSIQRSFNLNRLDAASEDPSAASRLPWVRIVAGAALFGIVGGCIVVLRRQRPSTGRAALYGVPTEAVRRRDELERAWSRAGTPRPRGTTLTRHADAMGDADAHEANLIERLAFARGSDSGAGQGRSA